MKKVYLIFLWSTILLISACSFPVNLDMLPTVPPEWIPTEIPAAAVSFSPVSAVQPMVTPTSQVDFLPTAIPSPTPFKPFQAVAAEDQINLRLNPGLLFDIIIPLDKDTPLTVTGKAPGSEWLRVETEKHRTGWVSASFLKSSVSLRDAPLVEPQQVILIRGQVFDSDQKPVSGLKFNIQQTSNNKKMHNEAVTDETGIFYAYMPPGVKGKWLVMYLGPVCSSQVMDEQCKCQKGSCGLVRPISATLTLPQKEPLLFTWN